jgi:hypothetical protein
MHDKCLKPFIVCCRPSTQATVRFQVLTAASMKIGAFWDVAPCRLIGVDRRFGGVYCLHRQGDEFIALMMEAIHTSETSVYSN